jgi:hypothetical protein
MLIWPTLPPCSSTKRSLCTKKPPAAAAGVVHPALEGLQHFDDERDDALGCVELAAALAGGDG